jgi:hypothetical protein
MMLPDFCDSITGATCLMPSKTPRTLTAMSWSMVATSISVMLTIGAGMPAWLTRQSNAPKSLDGLVDHCLHVGFARHVGTDEANAQTLFQRVALLLRARSGDDFGAFRGKEFGMPAPIPLVPPVTMATFPSSTPISISYCGPNAGRTKPLTHTYRPVLIRVHSRLISRCVF